MLIFQWTHRDANGTEYHHICHKISFPTIQWKILSESIFAHGKRTVHWALSLCAHFLLTSSLSPLQLLIAHSDSLTVFSPGAHRQTLSKMLFSKCVLRRRRLRHRRRQRASRFDVCVSARASRALHGNFANWMVRATFSGQRLPWWVLDKWALFQLLFGCLLWTRTLRAFSRCVCCLLLLMSIPLTGERVSRHQLASGANQRVAPQKLQLLWFSL
jgi:hypothetical protein